MIDGLIFQPVMWLDQWIWEVVAAPAILVGWFLFFSLSMLAYSIIMHGLFGQTLGKMVTRVKVFDITGQRLSMRQAVLRDGVLFVLALVGVAIDLPTVLTGSNPYDPVTSSVAKLSVLQQIPLWGSFAWFLVEVATMLTNPQRRAVHDLIAGSVVMRVGVPAAEGAEGHRGA